MKLSQTDLDFIWEQLRLPGNRPVTALDSTGLRDVQGIGNNIANPSWGAADHLFPRTTFADFTYANGTGGFTIGRTGVTYDPNLVVDYATRGGVVIDATPRIISNLVSSQDGLSALQVADRPEDIPGGRISPLTGDLNPLPYSSFTTLFGQFFDHGLDFVHKGQDGTVFMPLLPGDHLYDPASRTNFMLASRTNTASVALGEGSTDALVTELGLDGLVARSWSPVTGSAPLVGPYTGTLVLNGTVVRVADALPADVVAALNAATGTTGVVASLAVGGELVLSPVAGESFNTISSFIDLSQSYGSVPSHTVFVREYDDFGQVTGRLVSGGIDKDGNQTPDGMATWADIKANAARIGITLRDYNVTDVPTVRLNADGTAFRDVNGQAWLVALDRVTGETVYVQDTSPAALALASPNGVVLVTTGHAFLDDLAHGVMSATDENGDVIDPANAALLAAHFVAGDGRTNENIGLTALHDVFHSEHNRTVEEIKSMLTYDAVSDTYTDVNGNVWSTEDIFQGAKLSAEMQYQHLVFGEFARTLSPNIDGFAGYDVTLDPSVTAEFAHAVYRFGHSMLTETVSLTAYGADGRAIANPKVALTADAISTVAGSADVTLVMTAHGLVTGNHVTLSGIDAAIGGIPVERLNGMFEVVAVDADTLRITVSQAATATASGVASDAIAATLDVHSLGLIEAFLNPLAYTSRTAGEVALGMGSQVGNAIDEWMTPALRDNLVGLPLDLAALNIARGRDSGVPTLNQVRESLFAQTGLTTLTPYASWDDFAAALLHPQSLTNFLMAYARDAILSAYGDADPTTPALDATDWNALQLADPTAYGNALRSAAEAALNDPAFMSAGGNQDFWNIDLWLGGLAEAKVTGGMLGSTFDFLFARQMLALQNGDRFYYLERLAGTNLLEQIEEQLFADIVMRNTGVKHLYPDMFSVADESIELVDPQASAATQTALGRLTTPVRDAEGVLRTIGQAGYVGDTFFGNPGNYLDARGVFNPNGAGNESEIIGGTALGDRINGLGGNDALYGDEGSDTLEGGLGNDFVRGGVGDDFLTDSQGDDFLWGDEGNDSVNGGLGIDAVFGGMGDDTVLGGAGGDEVAGGFGNDLVYGDNGAIGPNGVLDPTGGDDVLLGGDGDDTLMGGGGADRLDGGAGNDVLYGGTGADRLDGVDGDDRFIMDAGDLGFNEVIDGGLGFDVVDYSASAGNGVAANGQRIGINVDLSNLGLAAPPLGPAPADAYTSVEGLIGTAWNDTLVGGEADMVDALGAPILLLDANGQPIQATDPLTGLPQVDLTGAPVFVTRKIAFMIDGQLGNDLVVGGSQADTLYGGEGLDTVHGALGDDVVLAEAGDDLVFGDDGVVVDGVLDAQGGADLIDGGDGNDTLMGGGGADSLVGGLGNDQLHGGAGADAMFGDDGDDLFVMDASDAGLGGVIDGGAGFDVVDYSASAGAGLGVGIDIDLAHIGSLPVVEGAPVADAFFSIESVIATAFDDTVRGGAVGEAVTIDAGAGNDLAEGNAEADSLFGRDGNDTLRGGAGDDTLVGGAGDDVLEGGEGADVLQGMDGNDVFVLDAFGLTAAVIDGGAGFDVIDFRATLTPQQSIASASVGVSFDLAPGVGGFGIAAVVGATGIDGVIGSAFDDALNGYSLVASLLDGAAGNDLLRGGIAADTLLGGDGDDTLFGSGGSDSMVGGAGDDTYVVDGMAAFLTEAAGGGWDTTIATGSVYAYDNIEEVRLAGSAYFAVGNASGNVLQGNDAENLLIGYDGNDTLIGGGARDGLFGVEGDDSLDGGAGVDYLVAGNGNDTVTGGADADEIYGEAGNDLLLGGGDFATDILVGGDGNDTIDGGQAWDLMYGGLGDDTFHASQQVDWVFEGVDEGYDTVIANSENGFYLYDNIEALILDGTTPFGVGNALANTIVGNAISNVLLGGDGADTLNGGAGDDVLWGEGGSDTFVLRTGTGRDVVGDFDVAADVVDLTGFGLVDLAGATAKMTQFGADIAMDLGNGDQLVLIGVQIESLTTANFVL